MSEKMQDKQYTFEDYRRIVDTLRSEEGCPWDRAQTKESLKPFMIEEMVEAAAAVNTNDMENLCEELGDQLLLILLQCSIARENGSFSLDDVIQKAAEKDDPHTLLMFFQMKTGKSMRQTGMKSNGRKKQEKRRSSCEEPKRP